MLIYYILLTICTSYGFSTKKPQETKMASEELHAIRLNFALDFWRRYPIYTRSEIFNVDETDINYDMPSRQIWAVKGRNGSLRVVRLSKHSRRMTAVVTVRADGRNAYIYPIVYPYFSLPSFCVVLARAP